MKKRLDQFRGQLDPSAIAAGMNAATANAGRLLKDAETLLQTGSFPTAAVLAILSIEESGKISVLRSMALADTPKKAEDAWRDYRAHTSKNVAWILPQLVAAGARRLEEMRPLFDQNSDHPQLLDHIKRLALYTDCLGRAHWSVPERVVDGQLATMLVHSARALAKGREVSTKEIELWVKHLAPVWGREMGWMKTAITNWHREMVELGLAENDQETFDAFIWDEPTAPSGQGA